VAAVTAARVLEVARRELGVVESPPGSNRQKYGAAYGWNGVAWCAQWAWWVLTQAGCAPLAPKTASTVVMRDWYRQRGQWHTRSPQPGDLVFFKFPGNSNPVNHVGIVEAVEPAGTLITIEGNTAGTAVGDQRNGGMVARKRRMANVVGFARPAYTAARAAAPAPALAPAPGQPKARPREDEMYIKCQPDPTKPEIWTALLVGPHFIGLGPGEARSADGEIARGATCQWVERGTWQELDRRSHALCDNPRPVKTTTP
jgi:hypothetical protein